MLPTINRSLLPKFQKQWFIISSLKSSTLFRYVLFANTQLINKILHNQIQYIYKIRNTGCICPSYAGWCRLSNWLQVRESVSSRPIMKCASWSYRWISPRLLALVVNCDNAFNTYLHRRSTSESSSWHAKAHAICYCVVGCCFHIKHVTQKTQDI